MTAKKKQKIKTPKCPQCGFQLKIHDYYGPHRYVRYICPNKDCKMKTITQNSLLKQYFYKCKQDLIYNVLVRIIDDKRLLLKTIITNGKIPQDIVEKCIRELLRHSGHAVLDNAFTAIPMTFKEVSDVYEKYNLPLPFIVLFPTKHKEIYSCIVSKNSKSSLDNLTHKRNYYDLLVGVQKDDLLRS